MELEEREKTRLETYSDVLLAGRTIELREELADASFPFSFAGKVEQRVNIEVKFVGAVLHKQEEYKGFVLQRTESSKSSSSELKSHSSIFMRLRTSCSCSLP